MVTVRDLLFRSICIEKMRDRRELEEKLCVKWTRKKSHARSTVSTAVYLSTGGK